MFELLINAFNVQALTKLFAAVAAAATVLTLAMPLVLVNPLDKRMRAVALEREKIRQRERERLTQENQRITLRETPKQYIQAVVDRFNLRKWVGQEEARLRLVQAGYRGQAPYVTFLFARMATPIACFLFAVVYLFLYSNSINLPRSKLASALLPLMSGCSCRSYCSRIRSSADSCL